MHEKAIYNRVCIFSWACAFTKNPIYICPLWLLFGFQCWNHVLCARFIRSRRKMLEKSFFFSYWSAIRCSQVPSMLNMCVCVSTMTRCRKTKTPNQIPQWILTLISYPLHRMVCLVLKTKSDDTALLIGVPSSPISTASSSSSMTHNSINNCSGETATNTTTNNSNNNNKYAANNLNDITVSIASHLNRFDKQLNLQKSFSFTNTTFTISNIKPLDDTTTPLFGEIFDELILPDGYCTLLSDDINPIDSQSSKMNIIDPFINYRDEMCETSQTSPSILSPDNLSKVYYLRSYTKINRFTVHRSTSPSFLLPKKKDMAVAFWFCLLYQRRAKCDVYGFWHLTWTFHRSNYQIPEFRQFKIGFRW